MKIFTSTIFGVNFGFEFLPPEMCKDFGGDYGILFDLLVFRVMFIKMSVLE